MTRVIDQHGVEYPSLAAYFEAAEAKIPWAEAIKQFASDSARSDRSLIGRATKNETERSGGGGHG